MITLRAFTSTLQHPQRRFTGKSLKHLDLSFTKIIPEGIANFPFIPFISQLESLDLSDNREIIEEEGLVKLYNFQDKMKFGLKSLGLRGTRLTVNILSSWLANDLS